MGESVSERVRDVGISHQSDWINYKQPIKFFVVWVNSMGGDSFLLISGKKRNDRRKKSRQGK